MQTCSMGYFISSLAQTATQSAGQAAIPSLMPVGSPLLQARNFAVFTGVQAGAALAIKKLRNGKEDVWGACVSSA